MSTPTPRETLSYVRTFAQFPRALRRFLASPLRLPEARRAVHEQMERREENFLRLVEGSVYGHPRSPYRALLGLARCERSDLRALVARKGVEGALGELRAAGVYVTFEEFKGRIPIVRHGQTIAVTAADFDNPIARRDLTLTTGGSTGRANLVYQDLDHIAALATNEMLALDAHGMLEAPTLHWSHILPGSGVRFVLQRARHGALSQEWFCPIGWRDSASWRKYALATLYMLFWMRRFGIRVPTPRTVRPAEASTIARAVRATLDRRGRCLVYSNVSQAVRVCLAAKANGFDLAGATFRLASEPLSPAKFERIRDAGARALAGYGSIETGAIGLGCTNPGEVDEVHLLMDAFALIDHPHPLPGTTATVPAFNLTGLRASAPKVMLNYESDDYGVVGTRSCGCALEALGYSVHLHTIRSYSKLVGEGVTLIGNELLRILEEALPARFGGSPLDYQIAEQEDAESLTRLVLLISPRVALGDEAEVVSFVLDRLRASSPMADAARMVWQGAHTLQIQRREPVLTARAKFSPLHVERRASPPPASRPP